MALLRQRTLDLCITPLVSNRAASMHHYSCSLPVGRAESILNLYRVRAMQIRLKQAVLTAIEWFLSCEMSRRTIGGHRTPRGHPD
jgi:hypothetical protein